MRLLLLLFNDLPLFITTIATSTTVIIGDTIIRWISRVFSSVMWSLTTIIVIHMVTIIMTTIMMEIIRVVMAVVVVVDPLAFFRFELLLLLIIIK
jgi:hypothetical protein